MMNEELMMEYLKAFARAHPDAPQPRITSWANSSMHGIRIHHQGSFGKRYSPNQVRQMIQELDTRCG
jgi:hypothetical protein